VDGRFSVPFATKDRQRAMQEQLQARLEALKKELEKGQAELQKVGAQRTYLRSCVSLRNDGVAHGEAVSTCIGLFRPFLPDVRKYRQPAS
jgi:hypothetical protein